MAKCSLLRARCGLPEVLPILLVSYGHQVSHGGRVGLFLSTGKSLVEQQFQDFAWLSVGEIILTTAAG
jgi:hypothetical protein